MLNSSCLYPSDRYWKSKDNHLIKTFFHRIGTGNAWVDAYTGAQAGGAPPVPTAPCADYVIIVDGSYAAIDSVPAIPAGQSDRYCGGVFPTVTCEF